MMFGDKEEFGIECILDRRESDPPKYVFGHIAMWAGGDRIGNFSITVMLGIPVQAFYSSLKYCGKRKDVALMAMSATQVVEFLDSALYGDNSYSLSELSELEEKYRRFFIGLDFSEAFDGEMAFLLEDDEGERFIWRDYTTKSAKEVRLKPGTYKKVVESYISWYSNYTALNK